MADYASISAWIALFIGFYSLAAAAGELRSPGTWRTMVEDFERSSGLRLVTGLVVLSLGAAIYLVNPWRPDDWLSIAVSVLGGIMVAEGALILASGERLLGFTRRLVERGAKAWAGFAALFGIAAVLVALPRLNMI